MSSLMQKLTAEKVKHVLRIELHYLRAKFNESGQVKIEIRRGKKMKQETQQMFYSSESGTVDFSYPFTFDITMHKKGKDYVKKYFSVKLIQFKENEKVENGRVKIDFSKIPVLKKPIIKREITLQHCSDPNAQVCLSVSLDAIGGLKSFSKSSPRSSQVSQSKPTHHTKDDPQEEKPNKISEIPDQPKNVPPGENYLHGDRLIDRTKKPEDYREQNERSFEETYKDDQDSDNESVHSRMSFSELIVHPKDSDVDSESSSSEEEYKELPQDRLIAHAIPKSSMATARPNENSKSLQIAEKEEKAGISARREGGTCANCVLY
ncbi:hypothetical protein SteCoe_1974 [Stentor coeruleus]|uniref:C2 NT-type domain-containing protein n=1 Tax=Stentor coeruleus TaxID=5963 RepID=A0A1R2D0P0_9CILI|nr:hypothetical protein SteCoe_1974 [Stentor coeruleus]